ncbi:MAG: hypothetical protein HGA80_05980, partial [Candidatus Omnitrophica bacterium]|nr:hypothetical protein [Candidatus Omnitrophota bacterium]
MKSILRRLALEPCIMFLLPLLVLLVLWAALVRRGWDVRAAFLSAQVIQAVLVVFWTEVLGACGALSALPMAAGWSVFLIISLVFMFSSRDRRSLAVAGAPWSAVEKALLAASVCIAAVTGLLALLSPPNTCDAMSYHMARVAHWAYNGTLANYPTNTLRQLVIQPYSEYAILQTYVLSGSDRFANLVQWNAMASSLVGVSLAASLLGGGRFVQLCAVWFAASFPMGILQASSTQTDYVAAFWAVCSAVFALLLARTQKRRWGVLLALAFGVAVFTKGTAVILGGLFLLWGLSRSGWRSSHKCGLVLLSAGIVLALHAGFLVRMTQLSANPFSALSLGGSAMVQRVDVRATLSNLIRGVATGLATPWHGLNRAVLKVVAVGHQWLGIAPNDPRFTLDGHEFMLAYLPNWEDYATGLVHSIFFILVAIGIGVSAFLVAIRSRRQGPSGSGMSRTTELAGLRDMGLLISFSAVFFLAVLVFCALVSWQEWIPRFQLPFFIIFSPVAAVAAGRFCRRAWLLGLGICMAILAWTPLLYNKQCPLLPSGAVSRDQMAAQVKDGGTVFDWMQQNGY